MKCRLGFLKSIFLLGALTCADMQFAMVGGQTPTATTAPLKESKRTTEPLKESKPKAPINNPIAETSTCPSPKCFTAQAPPLNVKPPNTGESAKEVAEERISGIQKEENDRTLIYLTTALAIAAVLQWVVLVWQAILTKRSVQIAERALVELESPYVFVEILAQGVSVVIDLPFGVSKPEEVTARRFSVGEIKYAFLNQGRSPARIIAVEENFDIKEKRGGPPRSIYPSKTLEKEMPWGLIIPPAGGRSDEFCCNLRSKQLGPDQLKLDDINNTVLYFSVVIRYADILENQFTVGCCLQFDPGRLNGGKWILSSYGYPYSFRVKTRHAVVPARR